ncbi:hypothetical protein GLYMA_07G120551v4 [Glycine max]|nr:hypothetical protein GLYMA_07G120551v4 [Glycine max]KAH1086497.1 hypothetical protein GYH30_018154 [Glycine max]
MTKPFLICFSFWFCLFLQRVIKTKYICIKIEVSNWLLKAIMPLNWNLCWDCLIH